MKLTLVSLNQNGRKLAKVWHEKKKVMNNGTDLKCQIYLLS